MGTRSVIAKFTTSIIEGDLEKNLLFFICISVGGLVVKSTSPYVFAEHLEGRNYCGKTRR